MSYGVDCRCGLDPAFLWLWHRPAATALIRPLVWEPPYAAGAALEKAKKLKKKKKKRKGHGTGGTCAAWLLSGLYLSGNEIWQICVRTGFPLGMIKSEELREAGQLISHP